MLNQSCFNVKLFLSCIYGNGADLVLYDGDEVQGIGFLEEGNIHK